MKKIVVYVGVIVCLFFGLSALQSNSVKIRNETLTRTFLTKGIPIIDIRTEKEWQEMGTVPGSHLITFYKEDKSFDEAVFLKQLQTIVSKDDIFAILCRSGNRSNRVSRFLSSKGFTHVINLAGGIKLGKKNGVILIHG